MAMSMSVSMIVRTTGYNMTPKEFDRLAKKQDFRRRNILMEEPSFALHINKLPVIIFGRRKIKIKKKNLKKLKSEI